MSTRNPPEKMRPAQAANYIGIQPSTLAKWRSRGEGPPFEKCGAKIVYYYVADLDAWLAGRKRFSAETRADRNPGDERV